MRCFRKFGLIAIAVFCQLAQADESWAEYQLKRIEAIPADPSSEDVELLATLGTNNPNPEISSEGFEEVKELAWKRLTAIPDFPDRLLHRIQEEREKWQEAEGYWGYYDSARVHTLHIMARVKHPEMVRVLGQLLDDWEWPGDPDKREEDTDHDTSIAFPNCVYAARALAQIIQNPPVQKDVENYQREEAEIYQLWYAQVKSGKRTFRIKGDPTEYRIDGSKTVSVTSIQAPSKPASSAAAMESPSSGEAAPLRVGLIAAACGILGLAIFAAVRARR